MRELGKYHARGIHSWDGGQCSFHPSVVSSCGGCDDEDELQCVVKPYESKLVLSCELHSLGFKCERRALNVESVIHTVKGRGHSNLCEAAFNILRCILKTTQKHGKHCRYKSEQRTNLTERSLTHCLQILLLRCLKPPLKTTSSTQPCLFLCQRSN